MHRSERGRSTTTVAEDHPRSVAVDDLPPPLLKPDEVAAVLNVTVSQVYTLMRGGELPAVKIGRKGVWRVSREALEAYLAALTAEAETRSRTS